MGQSTRKSAKTNDDGRSATAQRGLKQAEQIGVLKLFNEGVVNTFRSMSMITYIIITFVGPQQVNVLVATSVAEEGLGK